MPLGTSTVHQRAAELGSVDLGICRWDVDIGTRPLRNRLGESREEVANGHARWSLKSQVSTYQILVVRRHVKILTSAVVSVVLLLAYLIIIACDSASQLYWLSSNRLVLVNQWSCSNVFNWALEWIVTQPWDACTDHWHAPFSAASEIQD